MYGKKRANLVLLLVFILFCCSLYIKKLFEGSFLAGMLYYVAEAALIGGTADWFAVTALFTRPLGFSWHTALIPANREALTNSVAGMVKDELLSTELLSEKIGGINSVELISAWAGDENPGKSAGGLAAGYLYDKLSGIDGFRAADDLEILLKGSLRDASLTEYLKKVLSSSLEKGRNRQWASWLGAKGAEMMQSDSAKESIYRIIRKWESGQADKSSGLGTMFVKTFLSFSRGSEHTNTFAIASMLQNELTEMFNELKNPDHPLHEKIHERLLQLAESMDNNSELNKAVEEWKQGVTERVQLREPLGRLVDAAAKSEVLKTIAMEWGSKQLDEYWEKLKNEPETRGWIDEILKSALIRIIKAEHYLIGEIVRETLSAFTDEKLTAFIEEKVGEDLQWIRINGSIVGGCAGLLLYLFLKLLYDPFFVPVIRGWFI